MTLPKRKKGKIRDLPQPPSLSSSVEPPETLSPPPDFPQQMIKRPPFPEPSSQSVAKELESMVVADDITGDILDELKNLGFGAILETVTVKEPPSPSRDEIEYKIFMEAKNVYLGAGRKHLELGFKENAAMNFSCAILCAYLAKDEFEASHIIAELASELTVEIINNHAFQGAKILLKANLLKDPALLNHAKHWLLKNSDNLYKEDKDIILRAIHQSERRLKLRG